jgi:hypothetical protein
VVYLALLPADGDDARTPAEIPPGLDLGVVALIVTIRFVRHAAPVLRGGEVHASQLPVRADGLGQAQARAAAHPRFGPALGPAMRRRL